LHHISGINDRKIETVIFDGPQIRTLINDCDFPNSMNENESCAWSAFVETVKKFWGIVKQ